MKKKYWEKPTSHNKLLVTAKWERKVEESHKSRSASNNFPKPCSNCDLATVGILATQAPTTVKSATGQSDRNDIYRRERRL